MFLKLHVCPFRGLRVTQCLQCARPEIGKPYVKNQIDIAWVSQPLPSLWLLPSSDTVARKRAVCGHALWTCSDERHATAAGGGPGVAHGQSLMPPVLETRDVYLAQKGWTVCGGRHGVTKSLRCPQGWEGSDPRESTRVQRYKAS